MLHILVSLLLKLINFRLELPLVLLTVLNLAIDSYGALASELLSGSVLHKRVVVVCKETWILEFVLLLLHFHYDTLIFNCLWACNDSPHLYNPFLFKLPFAVLHLAHKNLCLQVIWLDLRDKLMMHGVPLLRYHWIFFIWLLDTYLLSRFKSVWAVSLWRLPNNHASVSTICSRWLRFFCHLM